MPSSFSIVPCSVWSEARMYEINYIDLQFFSKPQDKNSLNWPASWQWAFTPWTANILFIISEKAERIDYGAGMEGVLGGRVHE